MELLIGLLIGLLVGLVLGLTGAGGAVFAVPLLVLVLGLPPSEAMGLSLAVVSIAAMVGVGARLSKGEIHWRCAISMIAGGVLLAPLGRWLGLQLNETLLLIGFSMLALYMAATMWQKAHQQITEGLLSSVETNTSSAHTATAQSGLVLAAAGAATGLLSGLFGVGGGFFVVPILTLAVGLEMKSATATSLLVIAVISLVGFTSHIYLLPLTDWQALFALSGGAVLGVAIGTLVAGKISGPRLQEIFAVCVVVLMSFSLIKALV